MRISRERTDGLTRGRDGIERSPQELQKRLQGRAKRCRNASGNVQISSRTSVMMMRLGWDHERMDLSEQGTRFDRIDELYKLSIKPRGTNHWFQRHDCHIINISHNISS